VVAVAFIEIQRHGATREGYATGPEVGNPGGKIPSRCRGEGVDYVPRLAECGSGEEGDGTCPLGDEPRVPVRGRVRWIPLLGD